MKNKFIAIWALMLAIGIIPMSCDLFCMDSCGCGPSSPFKEFSIKNLAFGDLVIGTSDFNPDFFYSKDQYYKIIEITSFEYLTEYRKTKMVFHFINGAYACSPIPPYASQRFVEIKIINKKETNLSDNNVILEGQDISDFFLMSNYPTTTGQMITSYIETGQRIFMGEPFYLRWNKSITNDTELNFDIMVKLSDGQEFKFEKELMKIK